MISALSFTRAEKGFLGHPWPTISASQDQTVILGGGIIGMSTA